MRTVDRYRVWGVSALLVSSLAGPLPASADEPIWAAPPTVSLGDVSITPHLSNRMRGEFVDWFDPGSAAAPNDNNDYAYFGNKLNFGARVAHPWAEVYVDGQYSQLVGLPDDAAGLGVGDVYRLNNRRDDPGEVILREGYLTLPELGVEGLALSRGGRFKYSAGRENLDHTDDAMLAWLKKMRLSERLLGPFDFTHVGRSFDGGVLTYDRGPYNVTFMGGLPTAGGFNVEANTHMDDVYLTYAAATVTEPFWLSRGEIQLFHLYYEDGRGLVATDNRPLPVRQADQGRNIEIHTIGGHLARVFPMGPGALDTMVWVAGQFGDWQSDDHGASAFAIEGGYRFAEVPWTPWMRVGFFRGSGDDDPADGDHTTFFQVLPTARLYALTPFFNLMNNQDVFWQLILKPHPSVTVRTDYHYLEVADGNDLVYAGGGATQSDRVFGYAGFPARGGSPVAHFTDLTVIWKVNRHLQFWVYYGHAFGQRVIGRQFAESKQLDYGYIETTVRW